ncbi:MAG TPA: ammonium transporter [Candidatus Dormibacteraeota bacterium]|nr:ammonium transporter [Candidatus Dormibacteraeota bacterium]
MNPALYLDLLPTPPWLDSGHTAWQLVAATLVGLMSVPGLAIMYSGLMKRKWALNSALMILYAFGATLVVWSFWAFKMSFGTPLTDALHFVGIPGTILSPGDLQGQAVIPLLKGAIPDLRFPTSALAYFQFVFAAITVILLAGSLLGRTSFKAWLVFVPVWITVVYSVNAFSIWGGGWIGAFPSWLSGIAGAGALDFSGGYVIHVAAGISGLVAAAVIGPRLLTDRENNRPSNLIAVVTGAGLLWLGWNGFNGGDPYFAGADASAALLNTNIAAATAMIAWMVLDVFIVGRPTVGGMVNGMIAGLVGITPAAGYVDGYGAFAIGVVAGAVPFFTFNYLVRIPPFNRIDDTLGVVHTHLIPGAIGGLMVGLLADPNIVVYPGSGNTAGFAATGLLFGNPKQFVAQIIGLLFILVWDGIATFVLLKLISLVIPLRLTDKQLEIGDEAVHGDAAYELLPVPPSGNGAAHHEPSHTPTPSRA